MRTIWKWSLGSKSRTTLSMPEGAKILSLQVQRNEVCLWAECDSEKEVVDRSFVIVGTGREVPEDAKTYLGTFQIDSGRFIFHVYECS